MPRSPAPTSESERELLTRYVGAWESGDVSALVALLREDATLAMPPMPSWYRGAEAIGAFLRGALFGDPRAAYRFVPVGANGQPAFAVYGRVPEGDGATFRFMSLQVVTLDGARVAAMVSFIDPSLAERFGVSAQL